MKKLETELERLAASDLYPFHMPGHKRCGNPVFRTDITEIDGFDNLHDPEGILSEEMALAADFYGTLETHFLINGSSCGILAAISAAVPRRGRILIPREAHISVYHAAYLRDLEVIYMNGNVPESPPDAVVLTSPSYEGCTADVRAWADYAGKNSIPLIVDEAHGAHFSRHPYFPPSAVTLGADLVIQSTHKTLPAMTQTALLHNVTGRVSGGQLRKYLRIFETSSPSYVLLSSITAALHGMMESGSGYFDGYAGRLKELRTALSGMERLRLAGGVNAVLRDDGELPPFREGTVMDPGKILITCADGPALYDLLRERYHLQPEMKTARSVLLMTSVNDTDEGFLRLKNALLEIDREADGAGTAEPADLPVPFAKMRISEAYDADAEDVPLCGAAGRISAGFVIVYPPDAPLIVPGEVYDENVIRAVQAAERAGLTLTGCEDGTVRCLK